MKPQIMLLHNHDNFWTPQETVEATADRQLAVAALHKFGYEVQEVEVFYSVAEALRDRSFDPRDWLIFNWCEGYADQPWNYDGVTGELDQLGFEYTGSDTWALGVSADKARVQAVLQAGGVSIPRGCCLRVGQATDWSIFPAIVKPTNQHGSYGIDAGAVVMDQDQLVERLAYLEERFHAPAVVEEFIDGRELQVTVWGNRNVEVLPEVEVVFNNTLSPRERIYTQEIKFHFEVLEANNIGFICPSMLTIPQRRALDRACRRAYRAMRCRDYARIDVRLRGDRVYVLDVNPNPDINSESLLVIAANMVGLNYDDVVARIAQWGEERWRAGLKRAGARPGMNYEQSTAVPQRL